MRSVALSVFSVSAVLLASMASGGCVAQSTGTPEEAAAASAAPASSPVSTIGHEHLMLTDQWRAMLPAPEGLVPEEIAGESATGGKQPARTNSHTLKYYGGPVVKNVSVTPVYWNSSVQNQSAITAFYSAIVTGAEMSFLSQYSTTSPAQTIGNGTHGAPYVSSQTSTNVTDAQVQSFLTAAFNSGALPKPNNNTYYPVHFPSGVKITASDGSQSCVQFCAYHGTGTYNGQDFYYGVLPDLSQSGCAGGCGGSTVVNNTTSVASHEFAETVTDPAVGLATVYGPPLGWYNATYGEIGDICNGQQTTAVLGDGKSYTVQKLWSNKSSACVTP
jgi:hypothetical protein